MGGGVPGGSGSGGGGRECVLKGTDIRALGGVAIETSEHEQADWVRIEAEDGRSLVCTPDHPLYHAKHGKTEAELLVAGMTVLTDQGEAMLVKVERIHQEGTKVAVKMSKGHLFWANGFLSHNLKKFEG